MNNKRGTSFKQIWKQAIEKHSPKKATKLNEISYRFQMKLKDMKKSHKNFEEESEQENQSVFNPSMPHMMISDEIEKIKFVSMIDQKPIKPSYLDLIPMKNFTKKEQEA